MIYVGVRARYRQLPDDAWTRLVIQGIRGSLTGPRRRVLDPHGLGLRLAILWGLGGPALTLGGVQSVVWQPGEPGAWLMFLGGIAWTVSWVMFLRRPATKKPRHDLWGREIDE
jgi:hypothetical protein